MKATDMNPEQQAVVDRLMGLADNLADERAAAATGLVPAHEPSTARPALRTAIEELALQAAAKLPEAALGIGVVDGVPMFVNGDEAAIEHLQKRLAALASQPLVPAGFTLVAVKNLGPLLDALDRADRKGYLPDAMADEWRAFELGPWAESAPLAASPAVEPQEAPAEHAADGWEAPDFRKAWQGGLTNEELEQWWRLKLPHVEATNRDICVFALGVEVGAGMGEAPKPDTSLAASPAPTNSAIRIAGLPPAKHAHDFTAQEAPAAEHAAGVKDSALRYFESEMNGRGYDRVSFMRGVRYALDSREGSLPEGRACEAPSGEAVEPAREAARPEHPATQSAHDQESSHE